MKRWTIVAIGLAIFAGHFWFWQDSEIFKQNDLEANLLQIRYIRMSRFTSNWNPYISLPVWQDPLLGIMNPFWSIPLLSLTKAQVALKISFFVSLMLCGTGVYALARSQKVGRIVSAIAAMTYVISGYPTARIMAGHSEKVLSLAFMPWILYLLINKKSPKMSGLLMAMPMLSGDVYTFVFTIMIAGVLMKYKEIFWAIVFSLIRVIPIWQISGDLYKRLEPLAGTQNLFSIGYYLFFPVKYFWNKFGVMSWVPTEFAWMEKVAYIGPLAIYAIFARKNKLTVVAVFLAAFSMIGWRTPILRMFHSPARVFGYLSLIILILAATKIKNKYLWGINLLIVLTFSWFAYLRRPMEPINPFMNAAVDAVPKGYTVAFDQLKTAIHPLYAQEKGKVMLATNYGVMLKNTDAENWLKFRLGEDIYRGNLPEYIIYPNSYIFDLDSSKYFLYKSIENINIYKKL